MAATEVLRRSITQLCEADHQNDPETLRLWLANKTPERFALWLANPERFTVVAICEGHVCGVGMVGTGGTLHLCYVDPAFLRRGVGRAIVEALETRARAWGLTRLELDASVTARPFYEAQGYRPCGPSRPGFGVTVQNPYDRLLGVE